MQAPISGFQVIQTSICGGEELVNFNYDGLRWSAHLIMNQRGHWATDSLSICCLTHAPSRRRASEVASILTQWLRGLWS